MNIEELIPKNGELAAVSQKIIKGNRISEAEAVLLFQKADLSLLGLLANFVREKNNGDQTFFIRNMHVEPTNICVHHCRFCSYRRRKGQEGSWELSTEEILEKISKGVDNGISEVHMVGGTHPEWSLEHYCDLLTTIASTYPQLHIKAFTAVEIDYMVKKSGVSLEDGVKKLIYSGLSSVPGGGAEIFSQDIRKKICPDKISANRWLEVHEHLHQEGISSNATMLYGHIEKYEDRVDHLSRIRQLQDKTLGFNCFIPLKYKKRNNEMFEYGEVNKVEDLKNFAVSRIFLDNFNHIKAYWPMTGKNPAQLSLSFGVDDLDGTIEDTTRIYAMAGAEEQHPSMTRDEIIALIRNARRIPVERDALYNVIKAF